MSRKLILDGPLTQKEKEFAEGNHDVVYKFLHQHRLSVLDFYDIAIFGYLKAVRKYLSQERLQKYSFTTIAYKTMFNEVGAYIKYQNSKKRIPNKCICHLDYELGEGFCLQDTLSSDLRVEDRLIQQDNMLEIIKSAYGTAIPKGTKLKRLKLILSRCY